MGERICKESVDRSGTSWRRETKTEMGGGRWGGFDGTEADLEAASAASWGVTVGQLEGDFPALTAALLGGYAAVWSVTARKEGGDGKGGRGAGRGGGGGEGGEWGVGCSDAKVQSSRSQLGYMERGNRRNAFFSWIIKVPQRREGGLDCSDCSDSLFAAGLYANYTQPLWVGVFHPTCH